jgi:uncharacterized membrane protein YbaN (DUF454 family)
MTYTIVRQDNDCFVVRDSRVFHADWRDFDVRLVAGLIHRPEVRSVRLDLSTATCQIRLATVADRQEHAATLFSACVQEAITARQRGIRHLWHTERPWMTLFAERTDRGVIFLEAHEQEAGRLRLRVRSSPKPGPQWDDLLDEIGQLKGICAFRVRRWPDGLDIDYDPSHLNRDDILVAASHAWNPSKLAAAARVPSAWPSPRQSEFMVRGPRRLLYLALGCGGLVMTFVGLVVPGIPTVPFLLASSYYLARSSRMLHNRLLESRLLGQVLRDWETHRAMSRRSKWKLAGMTLVVVLVTALIAPLSPVVILLVAVMVSLTLIGVYGIPTIEPARGLGLSAAT